MRDETARAGRRDAALRYRTPAIAIGMVMGTLLLFSRSIETPFFNYDDPIYVVTNPHVKGGLSGAELKWAFLSGIKSYPPYDCGNWHPFTWLSLQADAALWGADDFRGFHLTSIVLHALNAALLFLFLNSATRRPFPSLLVGLLWAWHPLRVESATWVSERKDVLSSFFFLLALLSYVWYSQSPRWPRYLLVAVLFIAGLMAKPMVVTLPAVLLLLDYWPLQRYKQAGWLRLLGEKLPLLLFCGISSVFTVMAQRASGAVAPLEHLPLLPRLLNAGLTYIEYLWMMIWPMPLAPYYPLRTVSVVSGTLAWLALAAITVLVLCVRRRRPAALVGWLWYLGMLVPVIGLVQVGSQSHADRYTYLPMIGVLVALTFSAGSPAAGLLVKRSARKSTAVLACLVLVVLAGATWQQQTYWDNPLWIWQQAEKAWPRDLIIQYQLGQAFQDRGMCAQAELHYRKALEVNPRHADSQVNLGSVLISLGRPAEAIPHLEAAIKLNPKLEGAHQNLAMALSRLGRHQEAVLAYQKEVELRPNVPELLEALGCEQYRSGWYEDAYNSFGTAAAMNRGQVIFRAEAAHAYGRVNRDAARQIYAATLKLDPKWPEGAAAAAKSLLTGAPGELPNVPLALYLAETVCEATDHRNPDYLELLAKAQAANGDYGGAFHSLLEALPIHLERLLQMIENRFRAPNHERLRYRQESPVKGSDRTKAPGGAG